MSSKAFKAKTCVYCLREGTSSTADHVVAKKFFPNELRDGIPKVPACQDCNNKKSSLETYLTAVLPFGGRHEKSVEILSDQVPKRLNRNPKLLAQLAGSYKSNTLITSEGYFQTAKTLHIDANKIEELYRFIVRGLCWSEFKLLLPPSDSELEVGLLVPEVAALIDSMLAMKAKQKCHKKIAGGLFECEGAQAVDNDLLTIWKMTLYNVVFADYADLNMKAYVWYASTGPTGKLLPIGRTHGAGA